MRERDKASINPTHYEHNRRGLDFYDPDKDLNPLITIVGVGGIASWTALCLAKMGFNKLILTDPDVVEPQNVGCQAYGETDVGMAKVEAMKNILQFQTATNVECRQMKYDSLSPRGIVVAAVDNMEDRRTIFASCRHQGGSGVQAFIDCRIGGHLMRLYGINPGWELACERYLREWYPDDETTPLSCTGQQTAYVGMMAASFISRMVGGVCSSRITFSNYQEIVFDMDSMTIIIERGE